MPSSLDDYKVLETIGTGSYGICRKVQRRKDRKIYVWKEMFYGEMSEAEKQMLVSEVNLLRELRHRHIVRYYDRIIDRSSTVLYIVMEYCQGGDLAKLINDTLKTGSKLDEDFVWKLGAEMISALKYCHSRTDEVKKILHRDLKPANVFLDHRKSVKLGDFGLARVLSHDTSFAKTFVGTPYYMSPEQMNFQRYNEKSDIWSLGCIMYELCALRPPFLGKNAANLARNICTGLFPRIPVSFSEELHRFISSMLKVDESKRPSIDELHQHSKIASCLVLTKPELAKISPKPSSEEDLTRRLRVIELKEKELQDREASVKHKEQEMRLKEKQLAKKEKRLMEREEKVEEELRCLALRRQSTGTPKARALRPLENTPKNLPILRRRKEEKENEFICGDVYVGKCYDKKL